MICTVVDPNILSNINSNNPSKMNSDDNPTNLQNSDIYSDLSKPFPLFYIPETPNNLDPLIQAVYLDAMFHLKHLNQNYTYRSLIPCKLFKLGVMVEGVVKLEGNTVKVELSFTCDQFLPGPLWDVLDFLFCRSTGGKNDLVVGLDLRFEGIVRLTLSYNIPQEEWSVLYLSGSIDINVEASMDLVELAIQTFLPGSILCWKFAKTIYHLLGFGAIEANVYGTISLGIDFLHDYQNQKHSTIVSLMGGFGLQINVFNNIVDLQLYGGSDTCELYNTPSGTYCEGNFRLGISLLIDGFGRYWYG